MRRAARNEAGVAAACLLAAFGTPPSESDEEEARAYTGALLIAEAMHELRNIRKALTTTRE